MSDESRMSGGSASVNYDGSLFSTVRKAVERHLENDPDQSLARLIGDDIRIVLRSNGTRSLFGVACPGCDKQGAKDKTPVYLSSNCRKIMCAACGYKESVVVTYLNSVGMSISREGAEALASRMGIPTPGKGALKPGQDMVIDMGDGDDEPEPAAATPVPTGPVLLREDKAKWVNSKQLEFETRWADGKLTRQERLALKYVQSRGISDEVIRRSGLFVAAHSKSVMVVLPARNHLGELVGYQWFDYVTVHKTKKAIYKACRKEFGSCRWPFGVRTTSKDGPILLVCGFFDYLAALEMGFSCVLSPFGVTMLSGDAEHLRPVVDGRSIIILFDRKKQEVEQAWNNASSLMDAGAKSVKICVWMKGKIGLDLNDFLIGFRKREVKGSPKKFLNSLVGDGIETFTPDDDVTDVLMRAGLIEPSSQAKIEFENDAKDEPALESSSGSVFEPDLERAISGLGPLREFHTLIMFTDFSGRFEMCEKLVAKGCKLGDGCTCISQRPLDISDGGYSSAFANSGRMGPAVEAINETYEFCCPNNKGWNKSQAKGGKSSAPKRILYKVGETSQTWMVIEARSLFSSGSKVTMVTRIPGIKTGIYEVKGFKSQHCGMTGSVFVIREMRPFRIDRVIHSFDREESEPKSGSFFTRVSALMDSGIVGTPDMVLVAAICAWSFSPPVIPMISDIGKEIDNYRQPSMSVYVIGDPATGKTNTVREVSEACGEKCDPTDAKMATKPGLIVSGADGSPGRMPKCIGKSMGLDEITDKASVLEVVQLLIENRLAISMSGRYIDEVVPVRVALLSNADSARRKLHDFRTPMEAASKLLKEHLIRRVDICVATLPIISDSDADARNHSIYEYDHGIEVSASELNQIGLRTWRQRPSMIRISPGAMSILSDERKVLEKFTHTRLGNPMMYGDICQKVFRVACGIAGFCGSFDDEDMVVERTHVKDAINLMNECMTTMGASKEARFNLRSMDVDKAYETLMDICANALSMIASTQPMTVKVGQVIITFIQSCNAQEPGMLVDTGIKELLRDNRNRKEMGDVDDSINPYRKAWGIIDRMKKRGLISSEGRGQYAVKETFARSLAMMEVENPPTYFKIIGREM